MLSLLTSLGQFIVGNKTLRRIILIVIFVNGFYYWSYNKGYDTAYDIVTNQVIAERVEWQNKVTTLENKFNQYKVDVESKHRIEIEDYKKQVKTLKDNPKVITKYITKEVKIPCSFELLHNRLVDGVPINTMIPEDYQCERCTLEDVSRVMVENYSNCRLAMQRLETLQKVVKDFQDKQANLKETK